MKYDQANVETDLYLIGESRRRMGTEILRHVPHPKLYEAARAIVQARYEAGDYEAQYQKAWDKYASVVPCSVREARAGEEVCEALARDLAEILDGAYDDWLVVGADHIVDAPSVKVRQAVQDAHENTTKSVTNTGSPTIAIT